MSVEDSRRRRPTEQYTSLGELQLRERGRLDGPLHLVPQDGGNGAPA